jgi:hypothetical protein
MTRLRTQAYAYAIGTQQAFTWAPGATDERPIGSFSPSDSLQALSRVSVQGDCLLRLDWGTGQNNVLTNLRTPFVGMIPGRWTLVARPANDLGTTAIVSAVPIGGPTIPFVRQLLNVIGPALALDARASYAWAMSPCTFTLGGVASGAVPVGTRVPLVAGSTLDTGQASIHFEL